MRLAAIDLGSNSIHMVVVEVGPTGGLRAVERESQMVRLGAGTHATRLLARDSMERTFAVLSAYRRLARHHGADEILAVATSAVREATNGEEFLDRIGRKLGIFPKAITGLEEARLIHLAVANSIHLERRRAVVFDIGGGSVELSFGGTGRPSLCRSARLGALRLAEVFLKTDPPSAREERAVESAFDTAFGPAVRRVRRQGFDLVVGTSGTILALGRLAATLENGGEPEALHHLPVGQPALARLRRRLVGMPLEERLRYPGLERKRADLIVPGAILVDTLLTRLQAPSLTLCEWSLREGLLLDFMRSHRRDLARAAAVPDVRRRSVAELAERFVDDGAHGRHVAGLAAALFDGTRALHRLGAPERDLLEAAALLHDIGHRIGHSRHHKHSYYLIRHGGLRGFEPLEIEILANVARYHRRGLPRKQHEGFAALPAAARRVVRVLAGVLRVADALDRSHRRPVRGLRIEVGPRAVTVRCAVTGNAELEEWGVARRADLLEKALDRRLRFELRSGRAKRARAVAS